MINESKNATRSLFVVDVTNSECAMVLEAKMAARGVCRRASFEELWSYDGVGFGCGIAVL